MNSDNKQIIDFFKVNYEQLTPKEVFSLPFFFNSSKSFQQTLLFDWSATVNLNDFKNENQKISSFIKWIQQNRVDFRFSCLNQNLFPVACPQIENLTDDYAEEQIFLNICKQLYSPPAYFRNFGFFAYGILFLYVNVCQLFGIEFNKSLVVSMFFAILFIFIFVPKFFFRKDKVKFVKSEKLKKEMDPSYFNVLDYLNDFDTYRKIAAKRMKNLLRSERIRIANALLILNSCLTLEDIAKATNLSLNDVQKLKDSFE